MSEEATNPGSKAEPLLICTDMDRTLLPNGEQPESPLARPLFARLADMAGVQIAYVTGRHLALALEAVKTFRIPLPDYLVCDVGTSIYSLEEGTWRPWENWWQHIGEDWRGRTREELAELFGDLTELTLQGTECQGRFKLSYFADPSVENDALLAEMARRLDSEGVKAELVWSVDETTNTGLLDLLPVRATKRHAVEYLMVYSGVGYERTVFSGDSGNDLPVLCSPVHSILVANATGEVRKAALNGADKAGCLDTLYTARGGYLGMNGNYAAGILEGVSRLYPEVRAWLETGDG